MNHGTWMQRIAFLLTVLVMAATACTATETVTIDESVIASATSTALQDNAGAQDIVQPDEAQADDSATDNQNTATTGSGDIESGCAFAFVDSFGDIQIEIAFTNPGPEQSDVSVDYEVFDGNGDQLDSGSSFFEDLAPGEGVRIQVDTLVDEPTSAAARSGISCVLSEVEPLSFGSNGTRPGPGDSCRFLEVDSFDDIQVELTVVNPFEDATEIIVDYVLRGPGGVRFGESVAFIEVTSGVTVTAQDDTLTEFPAWVNESSFSCEILGIDDF